MKRALGALPFGGEGFSIPVIPHKYRVWLLYKREKSQKTFQLLHENVQIYPLF